MSEYPWHDPAGWPDRFIDGLYLGVLVLLLIVTAINALTD